MSDMPSAQPRHSNTPLIISLCVNLLLAGVVAIPLVRFAVYGPEFWHQAGNQPGPAAERMPPVRQMLSPRALMAAAPEKSDQIKAIIRAHHPRVAELRAGALAAHKKVAEVFGAPQLDKGAFAKSLAEMQAADTALQAEFLNVVSESVVLLTAEERRRALEQHPRPFGGHGWGRDDNNERPNGPPPAEPPPPQHE